MGSRLSSMLVQQGLLAVSDLQDAFTRQVVRGGALDTILLERELVSEDALLGLLSKVAGLTPMTPDLLERIDPAVAEEVPRETAERLGICPISLGRGRLQVLLADTGDPVALEELAYELGVKLHACAATELRVLQGRQQLYGERLPRRFARLLTKFGDRPPVAATLRAAPSAPAEGVSSLAPLERRPSETGFIPLTGLDSSPSAAAEEAKPATPPPAESFIEDNTPTDTPAQPPAQEAFEDDTPADPRAAPAAAPGEQAETQATVEPTPPAEVTDEVALEPTKEPAELELAEEAPSTDSVEHEGLGDDEPVEIIDAQPADTPAAEPAEVIRDEAPEDEPAEAPEDEPAEVVEDEPAEVVEDEPAEAPEDEPAEVVEDVPASSETRESLVEAAPGQLSARAPTEPVEPVGRPIDPATRRITGPLAPPRRTDQHPEIVSDAPIRSKRHTAPIAGLVSQAPPGIPSGEDGAASVEVVDAPLEAAEPGKQQLVQSFAAVDVANEAVPLTRPPLPLDEALLAMANADTRDEVLLGVLQGVRHYLPCVDLYAVAGPGRLRGRYTIRHAAFDEETIRTRWIRLDLPSVIARASQDGAIYIGPAPDTDASATVLLAAEILAPHLAIVPIQLRGKTVCVLIGHQPDEPVPSSLRGPLDRLAEAAANALVQLILRTKKTQPVAAIPAEAPARTPQEAAPAAAATAGIQSYDDDQRPLRASGEIAEVDEVSPPGGKPPVTLPETAPDAPTGSDPDLDTDVRKVIVDFDTEIADRSVAALLQDLDEGLGNAADILAELRRRGRSGLNEILESFPGRLRFDRAQIRELPLVSECSTVLRVLMHIGRPVIPGLAPLLVHGDDDVRFYATYLLSELTFPESVALLSEKLHDEDPAVRHASAYGLRRCKELSQYPEILQELREDLGHPEPRPRRAAMEALAALGDVVATPSLIAQLRDEDEDVAAAAQRALIMLTKQDQGPSPSGWRTWWDQNRQRHRVEWLIDGLVHASEDIRESSAVELKELTGVGFGYDTQLPEAQRDEIRRRYMLWWADKGLLDFGRFG